ncbi:MAG: hypothetical protein Q8Q95_00990 [bacterium]|nr:hypothetical protein [bacterium]
MTRNTFLALIIIIGALTTEVRGEMIGDDLAEARGVILAKCNDLVILKTDSLSEKVFKIPQHTMLMEIIGTRGDSVTVLYSADPKAELLERFVYMVVKPISGQVREYHRDLVEDYHVVMIDSMRSIKLYWADSTIQSIGWLEDWIGTTVNYREVRISAWLGDDGEHYRLVGYIVR